MPDITYDVGRVSFVMKGAWNLATAYEKLDAVTYDGSLYIAKQDVPGGTAITNTTYWQLAVEKGDQGETGNGIASITLTGTAGNVDTYTITFTDGTTTTFTVTNGGVTTVNGRTGDVTGLAEEDGSYPLLNAGTADNLTPYSEDSGATQDIPFIAQGTGCGNGESVVDTGSYLQFKKKLGNTVAVNQFIAIPATDQSETINGVTFTDNRDGSWTVSGLASADTTKVLYIGSAFPSGRKILLNYGGIKNTSNQYRVGDFNNGDSLANDKYAVVYTSTGTMPYIAIQVFNGANVSFTIHPYGIDLTLWFGSNDRIPSDLLSHPENWGRYYAGSLDYNAGTLESADGSVLTSIGRNVWDEEWELGIYNTSTGAKQSSSVRIRSKNLIPVIPNTAYYFRASAKRELLQYDADGNFIYYDSVDTSNQSFTTQPNCHFIAFSMYSGYGTTYLNNITISLYYSGESGYDQYYPFSVLAEVDTGSEVLHGDGTEENSDVKLPSGEITRKRDRVDMGTLTYQLNTGLTGVDRFRVINYAPIKSCSASNTPSLKCVKFVASDMVTANAQFAVWVVGQDSKDIYFYTPAGTYAGSDAFKTAMSGIMLDFPLATPTTEQGTPFPENIPCDDFGSMYWTQTKGIPQGNEIFYPVDYKASIDTLYNRVGGDMSKIVTEDEYPEAPSSDGTYVLKATVSGGTKTYAWVAE